MARIASKGGSKVLVSRRLLCLAIGSTAMGASLGLAQTAGPGQVDAGRAVARRPGRKNVLAWIDSRSAMQSHAASVLERLGYEAGLYDTYFRADAGAAFVPGSGAALAAGGAGFEGFDAILFLGSREPDLPEQQRAQLLSFVRNGGAFVGAHAATAAFQDWAEFHEMLGGVWVGHPWGKADLPFVVEETAFPGMQDVPRTYTRHAESYEMSGVQRDRTDVLVRIDATRLDKTSPKRRDGDFPMVWAKMYGTGRVYSNALGHEIADWDEPGFQKMYFGAMKWALGLASAGLRPHPLARA